MDGDDLRVRAAAAVADAIKLDTAGKVDAAAARYDEAAGALQLLLDGGIASDADRDSVEQKVQQYRRRAEQLRTSQFVAALPNVPQPAGDPLDAAPAAGAGPEPAHEASTNAGTRDAPADSAGAAAPGAAAAAPKSSLATLKAGYENASAMVAKAKEFDAKYNVSTTIGCAAVATYESAKSLEEDYKLSTRVKEGAISTYESARQIEEEYKVSEKVVEGVKSAAETAKKMEEEYKVSERAATAASTLYEQAIEYERQNRLRERMYAAVEEGWEALKDAAAQVFSCPPPFCPTFLATPSSFPPCCAVMVYVYVCSQKYWCVCSVAMRATASMCSVGGSASAIRCPGMQGQLNAVRMMPRQTRTAGSGI